jgi:hypothetical protein
LEIILVEVDDYEEVILIKKAISGIPGGRAKALGWGVQFSLLLVKILSVISLLYEVIHRHDTMLIQLINIKRTFVDFKPSVNEEGMLTHHFFEFQDCLTLFSPSY